MKKDYEAVRRAHELPFYKVIRDIRTRRGMSQAQLADAMGVLRTNISRVECGHSYISLGYLLRLADGLHYDAWRILRRAEKLLKEQKGKDEQDL